MQVIHPYIYIYIHAFVHEIINVNALFFEQIHMGQCLLYWKTVCKISYQSKHAHTLDNVMYG